MPDDLFDSIQDVQRQRLRALGWLEVYHWGQKRWQRPSDNAWLTEEEAFKQMQRLADSPPETLPPQA